MAEFETIELINPTADDFSVRWNGELYTVRAGESRAYPKFLAFHIAKHLSNLMLQPAVKKLQEQYKESVYVPQEATLMNHDNPSRRIALYDLLRNKVLVEEFFVAIPLKSFIGEMSIYDEYVAKKESASAPTPSGSEEDTQQPAVSKKASREKPEKKSE